MELNARNQANRNNPGPPPPLGGRMYRAGLGRFLTAARLEEQMLGEHPSVYASNVPTELSDPTGRQKERPIERPPGLPIGISDCTLNIDKDRGLILDCPSIGCRFIYNPKNKTWTVECQKDRGCTWTCTTDGKTAKCCASCKSGDFDFSFCVSSPLPPEKGRDIKLEAGFKIWFW